MRILILMVLLAAGLTGALLWNARVFAPAPASAQGSRDGAAQVPAVPLDEVVLVLGHPPGPGPKAAGPAGGGQPEARPKADPPAPEPKPEPPPPPQPAVRRARLQQGETIYGLAQRLLGKGSRYGEILRLNSLTEAEARHLPQGTLLLIPQR